MNLNKSYHVKEFPFGRLVRRNKVFGTYLIFIRYPILEHILEQCQIFEPCSLLIESVDLFGTEFFEDTLIFQ